MTGCSAVNCSNSTKNFRLFIFPVDPARRAKWIQNTRRDKWTPSKNSKLCEIHFEESQFEQNRQDRWKKLKPNAIPTLFNVPNPPPRINQPVRKSIYKHCNVKESSTLTDATNNIVDLPQLEKSTPTIVELQIKQEIVEPVWDSQEFVDDMTVKTEVDEVMSVDMSLKSEVKVEDHDVDDGCGEEENDGVDEDFSVDMSLKSEVKVEDHDVDDGCGEEVNDVDEEIKLPEAVFIKEEVDWESEEEDEESFSLCGENFNEGKDGNSGLLGGVCPATDLSSEKSMNCSIGRSLCTCTCFLIGEGNEAALNPLLWNARGKLPKHQTCEKCSVHHTSNDPEETSTNHKLFTMRKTSTQRSREYRERKRLSVILPKLPPKSGAERAREFRERRRALQKTASAGDFIIEPKIKISTSPIKMPKTSTQRSRECRERKRGKRSPKQPPKSSAQRVREYRERQKALKNAATSVVKFRSSFYTS